MNSEYTPLAVDSSGTLFRASGAGDAESLPRAGSPLSCSSWSQDKWILIASLITLICTTYNITLEMRAGLVMRSSTLSEPDQPMSALRTPTTYMGLRPQSAETASSFRNFPLLVMQADRGRPSRLIDNGLPQSLTVVGSVSPKIRLFRLSNAVSTFAQFRAVDYGYENCSLTFALDQSKAPPTQNNSTALLTSPLQLDVWMYTDVPWLLYSPELYDFTKNQQRHTLLDRMTLHPVEGERALTSQPGASFPCTSGSFLTFEFSCTDESISGGLCNLEFWNDPRHPDYGLALTQSVGFAG